MRFLLIRPLTDQAFQFFLPLRVCCRYILTIGWLLISGSGFCQSFAFKTYTVEDGLAQSQVRAISQDARGYLWIGTNGGGLSRFDGQRFKNYTTADGLAGNRVWTILEDQKGYLWIGTLDGGVSRYDGSEFRNYSTANGLTSNRVWALLEGPEGRIWVGTYGGGVNILDRDSLIGLNSRNGLNNDRILSLAKDDEGRVWIGQELGGICYYFEEQLNCNSIADLQGSSIESIIQDLERKLWFGLWSKGAFHFDGQTFEDYLSTLGITDKTVWEVFEDSRSDIWVGTEGEGLFRTDPHKKQLLQWFHTRNGLPSNTVYTIFEDRENNLWFGTDKGGITRYRDESIINFTSLDRATAPVVNAFLQHHDGILMGTFGEGLKVYRKDSLESLKLAPGFEGKNILSLYKDRSQRVWIGTVHHGAYQWSNKGLVNFRYQRARRNGITNNIIYSILQDHDGNMWFGTDWGISLWQDDRFTGFFTADSGNFDVRIKAYAIMEDSHRNLWFGTDKGVKIYRQGIWQDLRVVEPLMNYRINAIEEDSMGNIWIGSFGEGLFRLTIDPARRDTAVLQVTVKDGLSSNAIVSVLAGENHDIWIGTVKGINRLNAQTFSKEKIIRIYNDHDGFAGIECNLNASMIDGQGKVWFGTTNGASRFDPALVRQITAEPSTHISGIRLFYEEVDWSEFTDSLDPVTRLPQTLALTWRQNHLTFDFIGISLTRPEAVKYQFQLLGLDQDWQPETQAHAATYANLQPGSYTFRLKSYSNGTWNKLPAEFSFTIRPPLWQEWWFASLAILVAAALIAGGMFGIIQQVRRKEAKKTAFHRKMASLEMLALRARMNPHFIFNALNSIQKFMTVNDKESANEYLTKFANLIRLVFDTSAKPTITLAEELTSLELYLSLELLRFEDKFSYTLSLKPEIDPLEIQIPPLLLQPYVENAILHGIVPLEKKGSITIDINLDNNMLICSIKDNGIGRQAASNRSGHKQHHRSGAMDVTRERLELLNTQHQSDLSVRVTDLYNDKQAPAGTKVELFIPMAEVTR